MVYVGNVTVLFMKKVVTGGGFPGLNTMGRSHLLTIQHMIYLTVDNYESLG